MGVETGDRIKPGDVDGGVDSHGSSSFRQMTAGFRTLVMGKGPMNLGESLQEREVPGGQPYLLACDVGLGSSVTLVLLSLVMLGDMEESCPN